MKKHVIHVITMISVIFLFSAFTVFAEEEMPDEYDQIQESGKCGTYVTWQLKNHYVKVSENDYNMTKSSLIISGTGAMKNYGYQENPFYSWIVDEILIGEGVTTVGNYAFFRCDAKKVILSSTVKKI